jgi:hypothetical protein
LPVTPSFSVAAAGHRVLIEATLYLILLVEAAGIEPDPYRSTNRLMANDFCRKTTIPSRFSPSIESPGISSSPLE